MCVDGGITGCARQVLVLTVRDVKMSLGISIFLSQTEIDDIDLIATLADTHEEIIGLDVTMDERLGMDVLDARDKLVSQEQHSLQRELAVAEVEKVFQARTK